MNPLIDYVFLNLESGYDAGAVTAIAEGLRSSRAVGRKTLIVRIPPIERGAPAAKARVKEALDLGADGVTIPHVRNLEEAKQAISFFEDAKADVWSEENSRGETLAMLMIEDPGALEHAKAIADVKGYSILACGIGSLTQALGGNREAGEAGTRKILAETRRAGLVNMITATSRDVEQRVSEGFLVCSCRVSQSTTRFAGAAPREDDKPQIANPKAIMTLTNRAVRPCVHRVPAELRALR